MNEVSCRVVIGWLEMAERDNVDTTRVLDGFRHSPDHLRDPGNRTDWDISMEIMRRLRVAAGSWEAFLRLGQHYGHTPVYGYFKYFAALLFHPMQLYTYPQRAFQKIAFNGLLQFDWEKISYREVKMIYLTDAPYPACEELWKLTMVAASKLPNMLGLPDAKVELRSWNPHRAEYHVTLPPSGTLWAQVGRFLNRRTTQESPLAGEPAVATGPGGCALDSLPDGAGRPQSANPSTPQGYEVSCRATIGYVDMAIRQGLDGQSLLEGHRHSPEHLLDPKNRTDWEIFMEMSRRLGCAVGGDEKKLQKLILAHWGKAPSQSNVRYLALLMTDLGNVCFNLNRIYLYRELSGVVDLKWKRRGPRRFEVILTTKKGYSAVDEYWIMVDAAFINMPSFFSLPHAEVESLHRSARESRFLVTMPPLPPTWERLARVFGFTKPFPANPPIVPGVDDAASLAAKSASRQTPAAKISPAADEFREREFSTADEKERLSVSKASFVEQSPPAPRGNEFSCRVVTGIVYMANKAGHDGESLVAGFRHSPEHLLNPKNRTDWEIWMEITRRLCRMTGGPKGLQEFMRQHYGDAPSHSHFKLLLSLLFSPTQLLTYPCRIYMRMETGGVVRVDWKRRGPREYESILTTEMEYPATDEYWNLYMAGFAKLPGFLGLPDLVIRPLSHNPHELRFLAILPPSGTVWARISRFLRVYTSSPDPVYALFSQQHEDLRQSYEMLNHTERERTELARELLRVADAEREQFARDIHDGLGQELFALKLHADVLREMDAGELKVNLGAISELAGKAQQMARSLARGYDPIVGAGGQFSDAVRMLAMRYQGNPAFDLEGLQDIEMNAQRAAQLYRIVQEAVTNALRHGEATRVRIAIERKDAGWLLSIEDNGQGCDPEMLNKKGMGLRTMRYRAEQLGGNLNLEALAQSGTRVVCAFN